VGAVESGAVEHGRVGRRGARSSRAPWSTVESGAVEHGRIGRRQVPRNPAGRKAML
jgi:hypothetical protein